MPKNYLNKASQNKGFSLAEVIMALTIGAMILVAVIGVYNRAERCAAAIRQKLDDTALPCGVLQRIAEDLDNIIEGSSDVRISIGNKFDNGFPSARLEIEKTIYNGQDKPESFENIIWQSSYNYSRQSEGLVLYRRHSGLTVEDKLLDKPREDRERRLFIPLCEGVTFFSIQAHNGRELQDQWVKEELPKGVVLTISFAQPFKTVAGTFDVPEAEKIVRSVAIDRSRKIECKLPTVESEQEQDEVSEEEQEQPTDNQDQANES